ncbi:MAG: putative transcriptional regulator, TetR family [Ilumatobacteraceae bacterium]|nr:putative transcriptional regulator, TetR family [Ilumatobacteraceae bacterium]
MIGHAHVVAADAVKTNTTPTQPRGRPTHEQSARLEHRLRTAAVNEFLEYGFEGTSIEAIARAAGITKRTVYSRYADKRALFAEVIPWALARRYTNEPPDAPTDDVAEALTNIARSALRRALDPEMIRLARLGMIESSKFPEVATSAQTLTWSSRMRTLMDLLAHHVENGSLAIDDVELAAEQFLALVSAMPARLALFGVIRPPDVEERHLQHAVQLFLRGALRR